MDELTTNRLSELVQRKLHLLNVIKQMTQQQSLLIESDDVEELLSLLVRKNEAMESLQHVQQQIVPFQQQLAEDRLWASPQDRMACRQSVQQCEQLIGDLIVMENAAIATLNQERDLIGNQLRQMQSSAEINRAYQASSEREEVEASFLSVEG
jgi:hypothetical protein